MKNVNEIRFFIRKTVNEAKSLISEGGGNLSNILSKVIGLIGPGQEAAEDANQLIPELAIASNDDMDASQESLEGLFTNFNIEDQRDYEAIEEGVTAVVRKIARSKEEGIAEGRKLAYLELREKGVNLESFGIQVDE